MGSCCLLDPDAGSWRRYCALPLEFGVGVLPFIFLSLNFKSPVSHNYYFHFLWDSLFFLGTASAGVFCSSRGDLFSSQIVTPANSEELPHRDKSHYSYFVKI